MRHLVLTLFFIALSNIYSQQTLPDDYILPLPEELNTGKVNLSHLEKAIERLHNFSEYIYNPVKITKLDSLTYSPKNLNDIGNNNRWGPGSWGRGLFSKFVDTYLFQGLERTKYKSFYKAHSDPNLRNIRYWGTHPIISYGARTMLAYLYIYYYSDEKIRKSFCEDRFIQGARYLINQQLKNGGFVQWHWRNDKNQPNTNDDLGLNGTSSYSTADAIFALVNVYEYLINRNKENPVFLEELFKSIKSAGDYLLAYKDSTYHKNYISFSIWGLTYVYKVTEEEKYLSKAIDKYSAYIKDFQDQNGAWYVKKKSKFDYHDVHPAYMGIILRALIELYNILPSDQYQEIKIDLRKSIVKGINHFLIPGKVHSNFNTEKIRLAKDGGIFPYYLQTEYSNNKARALQLTEALIYAVESPNLFTEEADKIRLKGFLNSVVNYQMNETINTDRIIHRNSDIYFNVMTLYMLLCGN